MAKLKFIRLKTLDPECRCCGKGSQHVCEDCDEKLHDNYAFFIEVKDSSTKERKKPTGYQIALKADLVSECIRVDKDMAREPMTAGIYFIKQADLKAFLGDDYNNFKSTIPSRVNGRLLAHQPVGRHHAHKQATGGSRSAVELRHH